MKKVLQCLNIIIAGLFLIFVLQIFSTGNVPGVKNTYAQEADASEGAESTTAPASARPDKTYISKVRKVAKGQTVVKSYVEDFAMDGNKEAFVLTRTKGNEMEAKFSLWFVSDTELRVIKKNVLALKGSTLQLIKNKESKHVLFSERQFILNQYFVNSIYGVYEREPKVLFQKDKIALDVENNRIYGLEKQYCYYDAKMKCLMISTFVSYEFFWNEQEGRYMEYGAVPITKDEFLQYSGAGKIWSKLKRKVEKGDSKVKYTFLKRTNDTIDINMKMSSKRGYGNSYVTLRTKDGRILTTKINLHEGNKKSCKYPEIAY